MMILGKSKLRLSNRNRDWGTQNSKPFLEVALWASKKSGYRGRVCKWLRLPHDTPTNYFHAPIKDGGLGMPSLEHSIPDDSNIGDGRGLVDSFSSLRGLFALGSDSPILSGREYLLPDKIRASALRCRSKVWFSETGQNIVRSKGHSTKKR